jgi:hypothetical protein
MKGRLVSVVIPTRERGEVLRKSLQTVTTQDYDALEIIVSDNHSSDHTREIVAEAKDPRVKYINTGRRISMSENWEFALGHVTGDWLTILGDDDGLLPCSIGKAVDILASTGLLALRSGICAYSWPSLTGKPFGRLTVPIASGLEVRDSRAWLARLLRGRTVYPQLPMLYNGGYASMAVLREIRSRTGTYYRSCNPDIYSAIAIASVIDRYAYIAEPLAINGASRHSTGTSHFSAKPAAGTTPSSMFHAEENLPFHDDLPLCSDGTYPRSLPALAYESYLQAGELRPAMDAGMHERQLRLILAQAGVHRESVHAWGRRFADRHALDFAAIQRNSRLESGLFAATTKLNRVAAFLNNYAVGSPELPIADVYAASLAAQAVLNAKPGRLRNIGRLAARALGRL